MSSLPQISIRHTPWDHPSSISLRNQQRLEITRDGGADDPGPAPSASSVSVWLVAYHADEPVGCSGLREVSYPIESADGSRVRKCDGRGGIGMEEEMVVVVERKGMNEDDDDNDDEQRKTGKEKEKEKGIAVEIKRMFVVPAYRGQMGITSTNSNNRESDMENHEDKAYRYPGGASKISIAQMLLAELEAEARKKGYERVMLETGEFLHSARRFYERCGYVRRRRFGGYGEVETSVFYEKVLGDV